MIKWIKSLLKKIFGKKEPIILKDEVKIVIKIPVIETHKTRFKKSCPTCIEAAK